MPVFSKQSLELLRQRVDLPEVLEQHVELKRSGSAYKALCPFHEENTPSFTIQKGDRHYHCFGCGAHGDAIQFLMTYVKMSFSDAVEHLAGRFGVHLEQVERNFEPKGPPKAKMKEALEEACRFYHYCLLHTGEGHQALHYLYRRGLDLDFVKQFQIGWAPSQGTLLMGWLKEKGFDEGLCRAAGLVQEKRAKDFFSERILFPIREAAGAVIGFSGRKYREETFGGKYVNTPETPLFKKSRVLFGLSACRRRIAKERKVIVVEGQIDALRLIYAGLNFTVAGQGTAFGAGHVAELVNLGVNKVFLALDPDEAGEQAALKIGDLFQREGIEVGVVEMPQGYDPDFYLREKGPEAFENLLLKAKDYLSFLVAFHARALDMASPAGKSELVQVVGQKVRQWDHPLMVHESLRRLAQLTQVSEELVGVGSEVRPNVYIKREGSLGSVMVDPDRVYEADFLRWLLLMGEGDERFVALARANVRGQDLCVSAYRHLYETYLEQMEGGGAVDLLSLAIGLDDAEGQLVMSEILQKRVKREGVEGQFREAILKLLERNWMRRREEIRMRIQSGALSDDEVIASCGEFDALKRARPEVVG